MRKSTVKLQNKVRCFLLLFTLSQVISGNAQDSVDFGELYNTYSSISYKEFKQTAPKDITEKIGLSLFAVGELNPISTQIHSEKYNYRHELKNLSRYFITTTRKDLDPKKEYAFIQVSLEKFRIINIYYYRLSLLNSENKKDLKRTTDTLKYKIDSLRLFYSDRISLLEHQIEDNKAKINDNVHLKSLYAERDAKIDEIKHLYSKRIKPISTEYKAAIQKLKPEEYSTGKAKLAQVYEPKLLELRAESFLKQENVRDYYSNKIDPLTARLEQEVEVINDSLRTKIISVRKISEQEEAALRDKVMNEAENKLSIRKTTLSDRYARDIKEINAKITDVLNKGYKYSLWETLVNAWSGE